MVTPLLSTQAMAAADAAAIAAGVAGTQLMENAGWQVARLLRQRFRPRPVVVLCGPGNNGGDGFVVARLLRAWGWPVRLGLLGERTALRGDAAVMAARWPEAVHPLEPALLDGRPLVVDALFGAGLSRPLSGQARVMVEEFTSRRLEVVAIDLPSGVNGDSGEVLGAAAAAVLTVTFCRPKPGHALLPGRLLCGELVVADIGIPEAVLAAIGTDCFRNRPGLWRLPRPAPQGHKYSRGHLLVAGGAAMTGAARLVAQAGRRAGAGLCTLAAPRAALDVYRSGPPGIIVAGLDDWPLLLADRRKNAVVLGPGLGVGAPSRALALAAVAAGKAVVLDADALTSFAAEGDRDALFAALAATGGTAVLTPHDGEYARLFNFTGDRLRRARAAATACGAVVLLKGGDTVIAAPDGRAAVTDDAPPWLATGGSGDVLSGLIGGLLAQGLKAFEAACAGAWLHGAAARRYGLGMIAEDLIEVLPAVLERVTEVQEPQAPGGCRAEPCAAWRRIGWKTQKP